MTPPASRRGSRGWGRGLAQAAVLIGLITVLARVAGFGRTLVFSHTVTGPCLGTAYFTANQLPNIVFEIVAGGALAAMVVPVLAAEVERGEHDQVGRTASALLTWTLAALVPLSLAAGLAARPLMAVLLAEPAGCPPEQVLAVSVRMLAVFAPQIALYGVAVVLYGVLQAHHSFVAPALAPLVSSLVVMAGYVAFGVLALDGGSRLSALPVPVELVLSGGTTLGVLALVVTAAVPARRLGLTLRPTFSFPAGVAGRVRRLVLAGVATVAAQQISVIAVVVLANAAGGGGALPVYNYAWAVYLLPYAVLAVPIATSAFPVLSARAADAAPGAFDATLARTTRAVLLAASGGAALLAAVAVPAEVIFNVPGRGMARALVAFAPGLLGYALVAHLGRALYAVGRGRAAAGAIVSGWLVVALTDVVVIAAMPPGWPPDWTVAGLAIGNSTGMSVAGALLLVAVLRARGRAALAGCGRVLAAGVLAAAAAGGTGAVLAARLAPGGPAAALAVATLAAVAAGAIFGAAGYLAGGRQVRTIRAWRA